MINFEQITMFDCIMPTYNIKNKIRLIELFAGIGSQAMALRNLGVDFEHYRVVEFDKFAIKSYNLIHGTNFTTIDIRNIHGSDLGIVDAERFTYLLTYSFPCQDLSVAGKRKGMKKGDKTRSGLLWEVERLLNECENLPQILLMENVTQVHGSKNIKDFREWIGFLKSKGYSNYWQDLNAKDYGVAQNRDRCYMVSIHGDYNYKFPNKIEFKKSLNDYFEDVVDDKHYVTNEKAKKLIDKLVSEGKIPTERNGTERNGIKNVLTFQQTTQESLKKLIALRQNTIAEYQIYKQMVPVLLSGMSSKRKQPKAKIINVYLTSLARDYKGLSNQGSNGVVECIKIFAGSVYVEQSEEFTRGLLPNISRCIKANKHDVCAVEIIKFERMVDMYDGEITISGQDKTRQDNIIVLGQLEGDYDSVNRIYSTDGISPTLPTFCDGNQERKILEVKEMDTIIELLNPKFNKFIYEINGNLYLICIRKLVPKECWRLMSFSDDDFHKAESVNSQTQLYKQAGNSIVKNVLMAIFSQLNIQGIKPWNDMNDEERIGMLNADGKRTLPQELERDSI